jgi:hypothetical protein
MSQETRYVVRRADGKFLVIVSTMNKARAAIWIDNIELATSWPFMTGATLAMGLDLDPCLQAERSGWDVIPVSRPDPTAEKVVTFSVAIPALLICLLFSSFASAQSRFDWKPYMALGWGQGLDLGTTIHSNPDHPCVETNPRLGGKHATTMSVLVPKLIIIGGTAALLRFAETRDSKAARWIAKSVAYAGGIVGGKAGLGNLRTCGW